MAERALQGMRVVNTRAVEQAGTLTELLEAQGAEVLSYPAIRIEPLPENEGLDEALHTAVAGAFDWLVVTSSNTVSVLVQRLIELGYTAEALGEMRVAAIGPATAQAVEEELGLAVELVPEEYVAESLATAIAGEAGQRVFLPQSALARPVLAERLRQAGAEVTAVEAYRTGVGQGGAPLPEYFWRGDVDAVTFTSTSAVHNFMRRLKRENGSAGMLVDVVVACIGPVTAEAARNHDLPVQVVPAEHTVEALVDALAAYFNRK